MRERKATVGSKFAIALCSLIVIFAARANATEIIDDRVSLLPTGAVSQERQVSFSGQDAIVRGAAITSMAGSPLYTAPSRVLDSLSVAGVDFVLTESSLLMVKGKKAVAMPLGGSYTGGRLLHCQPGFFAYYLTDDHGAMFFTRTAIRAQMYFAVGNDFVTARLDDDANTIIATRSRVFSVDLNGRVTPLFDFSNPVIEGMEILADDNAILLDTQNTLVKVAPNGNPYTVLSGRGWLERTGAKYFWNDAEKKQRFGISGLELLGHVESDRPYAQSLLEQARKLLVMGLHEQALKKLLHTMEIMPNEQGAQELFLSLGKKLYGKTSASSSTR